MTETEWIESVNLKVMLEFLGEKATDRKLSLFAYACCRRIWHLLIEKQSRRAIEIAEHHENGHVTDRLLTQARRSSSRTTHWELADGWDPAKNRVGDMKVGAFFAAADSVRYALDEGDRRDKRFAFARAALAVGAVAEDKLGAVNFYYEAKAAEMKEQAELLRDIFRNPLFPAMDDESYANTEVAELATIAYQDRVLPSGVLVPSRLFAVADALESLEPKDVELINHLRESRTHVRGCWAIDKLIGRS